MRLSYFIYMYHLLLIRARFKNRNIPSLLVTVLFVSQSRYDLAIFHFRLSTRRIKLEQDNVIGNNYDVELRLLNLLLVLVLCPFNNSISVISGTVMGYEVSTRRTKLCQKFAFLSDYVQHH